MKNIRDYPGYFGAYTKNEAPQAKYKNGARIRKMLYEHGDLTGLDMTGTVLGSIFSEGLGVAYFVEWDDKPKVAALVVEEKLV